MNVVSFCQLISKQGEGDQKLIPDLTVESLRKMAAISPEAKSRLETIVKPLLAVPPYLPMLLGIQAPTRSQTRYHPGADHVSQEKIATISSIMEKHSIAPENTRIRKLAEDGHKTYHLLQASSEPEDFYKPQELASGIFLVKGDRAEELSKICKELEKAKQYASNSNQIHVLTHYIESFRTGSMIAFEELQKT